MIIYKGKSAPYIASDVPGVYATDDVASVAAKEGCQSWVIR